MLGNLIDRPAIDGFDKRQMPTITVSRPEAGS